MEETKVQKENTISHNDHINNYQLFKEADDGLASYGNSVPPLMGTKPDTGLAEMCQREIYLGTTQWTSTSPLCPGTPTSAQAAAYQPLVVHTLPLDMLVDSSEFLAQKLANWKFLHADVEFTIKLNNTKFQQGALWLAWQPRLDAVDPGSLKNYNHVASVTSLPGVLMNLIDGDTITMSMPYISEYETIDMAKLSTTGSLGLLGVHVVSSLRGETTTEQVDVSAYARLKNVKLYIPTPYNINLATEPAFARSGKQPHSLTEEAQQKTVSGIVSLPAKAVAATADAVGLIPIPRIQAFSSAVGWFSRRIADWATAHGLSKPNTLEITTPFLNDPQRGLHHVEGLDPGINLGVIQDNEIDPYRSVVCNEDEMSIRYIAKRPFLTSRFVWDSSYNAGDNLFGLTYRHLGANANLLQYGGTSEFVNSHFQYWHGSVNYTFKIADTFAHSGRMMISVVPNDEDATKLTLSDFATTQSVIWDIQDSSQISVTVPWMSNKLWLDSNEPPFKIMVTVVNVLRHPSTISDVVEVMVFKSYGEDYELAVPLVPPPVGYYPDLKSGDFEKDLVVIDEPAEARSTNLEDVTPDMVFNQELKTEGSIIAIGEKIDSLRQLIKQSNECEMPTGSIITDSGFMLERIIDRRLETGNFNSMMSSMACIYRFWAGSTRHKFIVDKNLYNKIEFNSVSYWMDSGINPFIQFTLPFYSQLRKHVIGNNENDNLKVINTSYEKINTMATGFQTVYFESAGDDFNFHYLTGPPVFWTE